MQRLLLAAAALSAVGKAQMKDVPPGHYAEGAVRELLQRGILTGYPDGTFRGNQAVSRYQAAVMLYRAYLTWTEEVLAKVRKTLEDSGLAPERVAEALSDLEELKAALPEVQKALEAYKVRLEALERNLEEVGAALGSLLDSQAVLANVQDRSRALEEALRRAQAALEEERQNLSRLEARVQVLERAVQALAEEVRAGEEARVKDSQEKGRRIFALEERTKALEETLGEKARGEVFGGVDTGGPYGGLKVRGPAFEVELSREIQAALKGGDVEVSYRERDGRREAALRYGLFQGIRIVPELGAGDGGYYYGTLHIVHEPQGGLLPGVRARVSLGGGLVDGEPTRGLFEVQAGAALGPVDVGLGYGLFLGGAGEVGYSALSASVALGEGAFRGAVFLAYAVPREDVGVDSGLKVEARVSFTPLDSPFRVRLTAGYLSHLWGAGTAGYVDRYRFVSAAGFYGDLRVGYEVRF